MNWIKENKFIAGFFGFVLVAAGVLAFLLMSAMGKYDDSIALYQQQAAELNRLQTLTPFPDAKNLAAMKGQAKEHQAAIMELQKKLHATALPLEPMSEVQFQDRLKETVLRVTGRANEKRMKLPEKFYMGFDPYQSVPPRPEAAPLLGRELKAMELVLMELIDSHVSSLNKIDRDALPEESDKGKGGKGDKSAKVIRHGFDIQFTGEQNGFTRVLNDLVTSKTQFFIPRRIEVKNEKDKGPARIDPAEAARSAAAAAAASAPAPVEAVPAAPAAAAAPAAVQAPPTGVSPGATEVLKYIVGEEKIEVAMRVEIVDYAEAK